MAPHRLTSSFHLLLLGLTLFTALARPIGDDALSPEGDAYVRRIRRELHKIPELAYNESQTSELVSRELSRLGVKHERGYAGTGIVASIGTGEEPCLLLRADMDALPITEGTSLAPNEQSHHPGRMHACGHDGHTSMLLSAARSLKSHESRLDGTVKIVFQPAEEGGAGAKRMLRDGAFKKHPLPKAAFALHVWPYEGYPTGSVAGRTGTLMAASGAFSIVIRGSGGHAALPHMNIDPVVAASSVATALQTLVSRETSPRDSAVVSVTTIHGGDTFNVVPNEVELTGTYRSSNQAMTLDKLGERIQEVAEAVASAHKCKAHVSLSSGLKEPYPPLVNNGWAWQLAKGVASSLFGEGNAVEIDTQMVGEDFAFIAEEIPSAMYLLGVRNESVGSVHPLHSSRFMLDENALAKGAAMHASIAEKLLSPENDEL